MNDNNYFKDIIDFYENICKLKKIYRRGWEIRGVKNPENVSDHIFGVAILALILGMRKDLDIRKCLMMSLIHDIGESIIGDIVPSDGIPISKKNRLENDAILKIIKDIDYKSYIKDLWNEYKNTNSEEAKFVKELDILEMVLQASEYEKEQNILLDEFFNYELDKINNEDIKKILLLVKENRNKI